MLGEFRRRGGCQSTHNHFDHQLVGVSKIVWIPPTVSSELGYFSDLVAVRVQYKHSDGS